jgi:sugar lactone lactonase YvrE
MGRHILCNGLAFAEGPRWRNGRLWFSDVYAGEVIAVDLDGKRERMAAIDGGPSGLGWLPDGTLLVARGVPAAVVAVSPDGDMQEYADLRHIATFPPNDMVVDASGRAWVGTCDVNGIPAPAISQLLCIYPDRSVSVVDAEMRFPNGPVVTPDGRTLIVAETFGSGMAAFTIGADGWATDKRDWARPPGSFPDGICLDTEGAVWFADPVARAAIRVREGGELVGRVETERACYACTLGGDDGRRLFLLTAELARPKKTLATRLGQIEMVTVDVPGSGSP